MLQFSTPKTAEVLVTLQDNVKRLAPGLMPLVTKLRTSLAEEQANNAPAAFDQRACSLDFAPSSNGRIPPAMHSQWHSPFNKVSHLIVNGSSKFFSPSLFRFLSTFQ